MQKISNRERQRAEEEEFHVGLILIDQIYIHVDVSTFHTESV